MKNKFLLAGVPALILGLFFVNKTPTPPEQFSEVHVETKNEEPLVPMIQPYENLETVVIEEAATTLKPSEIPSSQEPIKTDLPTCSAPIQTPIPTEIKSPTPQWIRFFLSQGYRRDRLETSYAAHHHHPNVSTKIMWKDLEIYQSRFGTRLSNADYFAELSLGYGEVCHGKFTNSNYEKSHEKKEWAASSHPLHHSFAVDAKLSFGKYFEICERFKIAPEIGYAWSSLHLKMKEGAFSKRIHDGTITSSHKPVRHLYSSYRATFDAPFIGFETEAKISRLVQFIGRYDFSFLLKDTSSAYWNKRDLHVRERSKRMKGFGHNVMAGLNFVLAQNFNLTTEYEYSYKRAEGGYAYGRIHHAKGRLPLNKSRATSSEIRLTLDYAL